MVQDTVRWFNSKKGSGFLSPDGGRCGRPISGCIEHRLIGTGDHKVLVLHDWFGTSAGWGPFLDYLDGATFSYAFLDYRGYGDRKDATGTYTLAEIADDALALADELGWERFPSSATPWEARPSSKCWPEPRCGYAGWSG